MKKSFTIVLAGILIFGLCGAATAADMDAGVKLGYSTLTGDPGDAFDGAFAGGLFLSYNFTPQLSLQGQWLYHKHDNSDDLQAVGDFLASSAIGLPALTDVRLTMHEFDINGLYFLPVEMLVRPYVLAGVGLYYWKVDGKVIVSGFDAEDEETFWDFGVNVGGGLNYSITGQIKAGGEITYTYVFDEFDGGFFNFLATISYGFGGMM